jgi:hypothetical protein
MKRPTRQLLDDLLDDAAPPEFRAALMSETLRHARRRKFRRRAGIVGGIALAAVGLAVLPWHTKKENVTRNPMEVRRPDLIVVETQSLSGTQVVRTQPGSIDIVSSSPASAITLVETRVVQRIYAEIDDEQLLGLLSGKPVALVRPGANRAELIFLDPQDEEELLVH